MKKNESNQKIPLLKKGDLIAIVAPAGWVDHQNMEWAKQHILSLGYRVVFGKHINGSHTYFSGSISQRIEDMQWALDHAEIRAIFCARGGYGSIQIIDYLSFKEFKKNPKWLVGFSDITVFLNHLFAQWNISSIHGLMPNSYKTASGESIDALFEVLKTGKTKHRMSLNGFVESQKVEGILIGGNLSVFTGLLGSKSMPKPSEMILFLEDISEYKYHIERMLLSLKRSGYLKKINGILLGEFTDIKDTTRPYGSSLHEIICNLVSEYKYPVITGFSAGHVDHNLPLQIGAHTRISASGITQG